MVMGEIGKKDTQKETCQVPCISISSFVTSCWSECQ